jgi:hypothetical protein
MNLWELYATPEHDAFSAAAAMERLLPRVAGVIVPTPPLAERVGSLARQVFVIPYAPTRRRAAAGAA